MATDQAVSAAERLLHDALLDLVPNHPDDCRICRAPAATDEEHPPMSGENPTFTQADIDAAVEAAVKTATDKLPAAVAEATKPLQDKIAELEGAAAGDAHAAEIADLKAQIDTLEAKANAATKANEDVVAYLDSVKAEQDEEAEKATRLDARKAEVATLGIFKPEQLDAKAPTWATLDDEQWTARLAEFQEIATEHKIPPVEVKDVEGKGKDDEPLGTPLTAAAAGDPPKKASAAAAVLRLDPSVVRQTI